MYFKTIRKRLSSRKFKKNPPVYVALNSEAIQYFQNDLALSALRRGPTTPSIKIVLILDNRRRLPIFFNQFIPRDNLVVGFENGDHKKYRLSEEPIKITGPYKERLED